MRDPAIAGTNMINVAMPATFWCWGLVNPWLQKRGIVTETIYTALFPKAPEGSTPDALAVAPDGKTLYVANADNNCIAVIDIRESDRSQVVGFIPTGWYPTSVAVTPAGKSLLVGVGKGLQTRPNPIVKGKKIKKASDDPDEGRPELPFPYIGTTLSGALSMLWTSMPRWMSIAQRAASTCCART